MNEQLSLPNKAVQVAADLLNITKSEIGDERNDVGTNSAEAYAAFQTAEGLRGQENDSGLDGAIEKYKQAIEIDPTMRWQMRSWLSHTSGCISCIVIPPLLYWPEPTAKRH